MRFFVLPGLSPDVGGLAGAGRSDPFNVTTLGSRPAEAEQFIRGALQEGLCQVQAVGIVRARSQRHSVCELAGRLQHRFSVTNDSLRTLIRRFKTAFPLDNDHHSTLAVLRAAPSRDFDLTYLGKTIRMHEVLLSLYASASDNEQLSAPVQEFAGTMLPLVAADLEDTMRLRALVAREVATG